MQDFSEIYFELLREVENTIRLLGGVQLKAEEMFVKLKQGCSCANYTNEANKPGNVNIAE